MTSWEIFACLKRHAPLELQESYDNAGFLVGERNAKVQGVLVALDITKAVVSEAKELGLNVIVAHHPILFEPRRQITDEDGVGQILMSLIQNKICAICMHTNLDAVQGGVNDLLAKAAGLQNPSQLYQSGVDENGNAYGIGRIGYLQQPSNTVQYAKRMKEALQANGIRYCDAGRPVHHVAVGGGSCGSMLQTVIERGCDTFVTADVKYDVFLEAMAMGINLIDAGHYATEQVVLPALEQWLGMEFNGLKVQRSAVQRDPVQFL